MIYLIREKVKELNKIINMNATSNSPTKNRLDRQGQRQVDRQGQVYQGQGPSLRSMPTCKRKACVLSRRSLTFTFVKLIF